MIKNLLVAVALCFATEGKAQTTDGAPQEPPFIQEDTEFQDSSVQKAEEEDALAIEEEIQKPQESKSVDLNKDTDADKDLIKELGIEDEPIEDTAISESVQPQAPPQMEPAPSVPNKNSAYQQRLKQKRNGKKDSEYIDQPLAAKGLISIRKDGSYVYKTKEDTSHKQSGIFRFAMMDPPKITARDGTSYQEMYSVGSQTVLFFDYEWQPYQKFGKWGLQGGAGLLWASGKGRFTDGSGEEAKESYNFIAIPLNFGVVYRMEWFNRQWLVPYVSGGGTYVGILEVRDDGKMATGGAPGAYGAGGLMFNISAIDRQTAFTMNSEYGIKNLWVSLDYRYLKTFKENIDFSSHIIGAAVAVDY